jgi:hypothetical protein
MSAVFDSAARTKFAGNYPEIPHMVRHSLGDHPLLTLDALARLGEALPSKSVEYNLGALPIGIDQADIPMNGLSIGDTIRNVEQSKSWAVLKNIEQAPEYEELLIGILNELKPHIEQKTGQMMRPQGFIFVSSPAAMTPYHFDPEHNILMQLRGHKVMTQFEAGNTRFAPDTAHEEYHTGGPRNIIWNDDNIDAGTAWRMEPGDALFVPVMAPHFVKNGSVPSVSLSITWRSDWSFAEADARALNKYLRKIGLNPAAPGRYPAQNKAKAYIWRGLARLGLVPS